MMEPGTMLNVRGFSEETLHAFHVACVTARTSMTEVVRRLAEKSVKDGGKLIKEIMA